MTPPTESHRPDLDDASSTSLLGPVDLHLFNEGRHDRAYEKLGSHLRRVEGIEGVSFAVWAPNAAEVSVIGDFNDWRPGVAKLTHRGSSGIWEGFLPGVQKGARYKYHIRSRYDGYEVAKADPYAIHHAPAPATESVVWDRDYVWGDAGWFEGRAGRDPREEPLSIYELHLGSWRKRPGEALTYRSIADDLIAHVLALGFTHVEFLPLMEHPFHGSWGYQVTGYFAACSRYGTPQDLMYLIDRLHQAGIGVLLDWVPSHFPTDEHGLIYFDGTHLYEHADPRQGMHPDWNTSIFNYGRGEVVSFLLSSARFWLDAFHADGLRVDAVASMLYLDYSREAGEWIPNQSGGRENLEAVAFLRQLNAALAESFPHAITVAEESTTWPMVSRPESQGGLGFTMKWDLGWMNDTLRYMQKDPIHRSFHQGLLTFRSIYAYNENFVLPLSHDEVVHGKGSLLGKMSGDEWRRFANLRTLYGYMYATPGKKLLFMGCEVASYAEWNHDAQVDWHLDEQPEHAGIAKLVHDLNRIYREHPALYELDFEPAGFEWLDVDNVQQSVAVVLRKGRDPQDRVLVAVNFTPVPRANYRIGVPAEGVWNEVLNTDWKDYGGSGHGNLGSVEPSPVPWRNQPYSIVVTLPPLSAVFFALERRPSASPPRVERSSSKLRTPQDATGGPASASASKRSGKARK